MEFHNLCGYFFLLYNVCRIGPNAEVDGWNYYVRGPTT